MIVGSIGGGSCGLGRAIPEFGQEWLVVFGKLNGSSTVTLVVGMLVGWKLLVPVIFFRRFASGRQSDSASESEKQINSLSGVGALVLFLRIFPLLLVFLACG